MTDNLDIGENSLSDLTESEASNSSTQLIDSELMALLSVRRSSSPWPRLRQFDEVPLASEQQFDIGLGDDHLIHSIQISSFLRTATLGRSLAAPSLIAKSKPDFMPLSNLTQESVQELLKRAIVLVCVYCGYEMTTDSILQTLVDICASFIERICQILKLSVDTKELRNGEDFSIELYQTFEDIGFPMSSLQQYVHSIERRKNNLVREVQKTHGITIDVVDPRPKRTEDRQPDENVEPLSSLIVGLEDQPEPTHDEGKSDWEKSLNELGVSMDPNNGDFFDYESLGS